MVKKKDAEAKDESKDEQAPKKLFVGDKVTISGRSATIVRVVNRDYVEAEAKDTWHRVWFKFDDEAVTRHVRAHLVEKLG